METLSKFLYWKPYSNVHVSTCLGWMSFAAFIVKKSGSIFSIKILLLDFHLLKTPCKEMIGFCFSMQSVWLHDRLTVNVRLLLFIFYTVHIFL